MFDLAIVGTSPMLLLEALNAAIGGSSVIIVDKSRNLGGAWQSPDIVGMAGVEIGCHYIEPIEPVYGLLANLGVVLENSMPVALHKSKKVRQPVRFLMPKIGEYSAIKDLHYHRTGFAKSAIMAKLDMLKVHLQGVHRARSIQYPSGNSRALVDNLVDQLRRYENVEFCNEQVEKAVSLANDVCLKCVAGRTINTRKLVFGQRADFFIVANGQKVRVDRQDATAISVIINSAELPNLPARYVNVHDGKLVKRLCGFADPKGNYGIVAQVHKSAVDMSNINGDSLAERCLDELVNMGILQSSGCRSEVLMYEGSFIPCDQVIPMNTLLPSNVRLLYTYDLAKSILFRMAEWTYLREKHSYSVDQIKAIAKQVPMV